MTTWGELKRSETPLNWRRMLQELTFTPEQLVKELANGIFLHNLQRKVDKVMTNPMPNVEQNDVVDMDELNQQNAEQNSEVDESPAEMEQTIEQSDSDDVDETEGEESDESDVDDDDDDEDSEDDE